jgi:hypothetical protein
MNFVLVKRYDWVAHVGDVSANETPWSPMFYDGGALVVQTFQEATAATAVMRYYGLWSLTNTRGDLYSIEGLHDPYRPMTIATVDEGGGRSGVIHFDTNNWMKTRWNSAYWWWGNFKGAAGRKTSANMNAWGSKSVAAASCLSQPLGNLLLFGRWDTNEINGFRWKQSPYEDGAVDASIAWTLPSAGQRAGSICIFGDMMAVPTFTISSNTRVADNSILIYRIKPNGLSLVETIDVSSLLEATTAGIVSMFTDGQFFYLFENGCTDSGSYETPTQMLQCVLR